LASEKHGLGPLFVFGLAVVVCVKAKMVYFILIHFKINTTIKEKLKNEK